eukprot:m.142777 g.142777  ORF g.142777 m.142777 type:complete len:575 (-) comp16720_c0_seq5:97-1821(-)
MGVRTQTKQIEKKFSNNEQKDRFELIRSSQHITNHNNKQTSFFHSVVVELGADEEARADLLGVVDDKLVVLEGEAARVDDARVGERAAGHADLVAVQVDVHALVGLGCCLALAQGAVRAGRLLEVQHRVGLEQLVVRAEGHLAEQQQARVARAVREAVVGRLGHRVGKVHALAKHVAGAGRLGRRNAQALREDADPVCEAGAVPEEGLVVEAGVVGPVLLVDAEELLDLQRVAGVGLAVRVLDVLLHQAEVLVHRVDRAELALERLVVLVHLGLGVGRVARRDDLHGRLDVVQRLEHGQLLLDHVQGADDRRAAHAKDVRDARVELVGGLLEEVALGVGVDEGLDVLERLVAGLDLVGGQLAERQLLDVVAHLHHRVCHALHVKDELHQALHCGRQLRGILDDRPAGRRLGQLLLDLLLLLGSVGRIVDLHQIVLAGVVHKVGFVVPVVGGLVAELAAEGALVGLEVVGRGRQKLVLAGRADAAPARPYLVVLARVGLEQLDDVVLVVVVADVGLVARKVPGSVGVRVDVVGRGVRALRVDGRLALDHDLGLLLLVVVAAARALAAASGTSRSR